MYDFNSIANSLQISFEKSESHIVPYNYCRLENCLPQEVIDEIKILPFEPQNVGEKSGKRELHNDTRIYFNSKNRAVYDICNAVATAFQIKRVISAIQQFYDADLKGTYLRIEYAQDTDGFWLEPHTDINEKKLTIIIYLESPDENLGTDIYNGLDIYSTIPFIPNTGLVFIPSRDTIHGVSPRKINGVRKSLIVNYVSEDWRDRDQLCFPNTAIRHLLRKR